MAVAVSYREFKPADSREDLIRLIQTTPDRHAEAVLSAYALLGQLHDKGLLDLATGLLSASPTIVEKLVDVVSAKETINALRIAVSLLNVFAKVDAGALLHALENAPDDPPSLWQIGKEFNSEDARRALAVTARALNVAGAALGDRTEKERAG